MHDIESAEIKPGSKPVMFLTNAIALLGSGLRPRIRLVPLKTDVEVIAPIRVVVDWHVRWLVLTPVPASDFQSTFELKAGATEGLFSAHRDGVCIDLDVLFTFGPISDTVAEVNHHYFEGQSVTLNQQLSYISIVKPPKPKIIEVTITRAHFM